MRFVLFSLALVVGATSARAAIHREALWVVLQSCVVAQNTAGIPFPCLVVSLASTTDPGYAVLRAPFSATRVLVVPIERVEGIPVDEWRTNTPGGPSAKRRSGMPTRGTPRIQPA